MAESSLGDLTGIAIPALLTPAVVDAGPENTHASKRKKFTMPQYASNDDKV